MKTVIAAVLLFQPGGIDATLKHIFNGPGPSVVIGDTSTPPTETFTTAPQPDGSVIVCYQHAGQTKSYACVG